MAGLEDLLSQIPTSDIASKIGVDEGEVNKAVHLLVPVLVGGLQENAQDPDHASNIESAADSHAASGLLDGGVSLDHVNEADGQQAIAKIFGGNDATQVASALAGGGGGNSDLLKQLLPILAPIVLAYIGKQTGPEERTGHGRRRPPVARSTMCWAASSAGLPAATSRWAPCWAMCWVPRRATSSADCSARSRPIPSGPPAAGGVRRTRRCFLDLTGDHEPRTRR